MWKEFEPEARPFNSDEEMHEAIITRWNSVVKPQDRVYHLGDVAFIRWSVHNAIETFNSIVQKLNGHKYLIAGNHDDRKLLKAQSSMEVLPAQWKFKWNKQVFILSHFPMLTWDRSHHGTFQLFGHHHGHLKTKWRQMDVGVDAHNLTPISVEEVFSILHKRPIFRGHKEGRAE